jgi:hypothetical protein
MRAVIEGRRYDTETADLIARWSYGDGPQDWHHVQEKLYRTRQGSWFIAGSGGARSKYRVSTAQRTWYPGERIDALSSDEALEWLETH